MEEKKELKKTEEKETRRKKEKTYTLVTVELYQDRALEKIMEPGDVQEANTERTIELLNSGYVKLKK